MTWLQANAELLTHLAHPLLPFRDFSLAPHSSTLSLRLEPVSPSANTYDFLLHASASGSSKLSQPTLYRAKMESKHALLVKTVWFSGSEFTDVGRGHQHTNKSKSKRLDHPHPVRLHGTMTGHRYSRPDHFLRHSQVTPSKARTCAWGRVNCQGHGRACNPHLLRLSFTGLSGEAKHLLHPGKANKSVTLGAGAGAGREVCSSCCCLLGKQQDLGK